MKCHQTPLPLEYTPNSLVENAAQYAQTWRLLTWAGCSTIPLHERFALGKLLFSDDAWHSDWLSYFVFAVSLACKSCLILLGLLQFYPCGKLCSFPQSSVREDYSLGGLKSDLEMHRLTFLEVRSPKSRCWPSCFLLRLVKKNLFQDAFLVVSWQSFVLLGV